MGLHEQARALEQARRDAVGSDRALITAELAWCHIEAGALGEAFRLLWELEDAGKCAPLLELTRAEIQAYCGNEDAAIALLDGATDGATAAMVRARIAAARGDWESVRAAVPSDAPDASQRALVLAARACIELGRLDEASTLLGRVEPRSTGEALAVSALRARIGPEDPADALARVAVDARTRGAARIQAEAWTDLALWHRSQRRTEPMRRAAVRATALWDDMVTSLPPPLRAGFWSDARRGAVQNAARRLKPGTASRASDGLAPLLSNLRKLTSERDPSRLLSVITDGAISLSGAERGYVLLVDEQGALSATTVRGAENTLGKKTAAFSRSIAETVLLDAEPIVTVDAAHDTRVQDYMSVHRLMLKSVACLPIESRGRTWGVLYLEHRSASGRFSGIDLELLRAYADQAAIAIETSDLLAKIEAQKHHLQRANEALRQANAQLEQRLQGQAAALEQTKRQIQRLQSSTDEGDRWGLIGTSEAIRRVYERMDRIAASDVPVVIVGESGTGKGLIARALHRGSARAEGPYVSLSCGAIPEGLLESELFGHVPGAFTGAGRARDGLFVQAHGGTLFLDEIADMPLRMQLDLLRVLQEQRIRPVGAAEERPVDVRLVAASKEPLKQLMERGRLREDLYYRLAVVELDVPPLRERRSDIPLLCDHFLRRIAEDGSEPPKRLSPEALQRLFEHDFPGNVRELEHLLVHAAVFAQGDLIEVDHLSIPTAAGDRDPHGRVDNYREYKEAERDRILAALNAHDWNRARAARSLGMARRTFYRRLREHGIELAPKGKG
jgi:DNA-binding NtrC family response regulator